MWLAVLSGEVGQPWGDPFPTIRCCVNSARNPSPHLPPSQPTCSGRSSASWFQPYIRAWRPW